LDDDEANGASVPGSRVRSADTDQPQPDQSKSHSPSQSEDLHDREVLLRYVMHAPLYEDDEHVLKEGG
jgi:hypothetical protein